MSLGSFLGSIVGPVLGGLIGSDGAEDSAKIGSAAELQAMEMQLQAARENRDISLAIQGPGRQAGYTAMSGLMDMAGLSRANYSPIGGTPAGNGMAGNGSDGVPGPQPGIRGSGTTAGTPSTPPPTPPAPGVRRSNPEVWRAYLTARSQWEAGQAAAPAQTPAQQAQQAQQQQAAYQTTYGIPNLSSIPAYNWQADPGYQFRMDEGMRALEGSAAARGGLLSGGFARAVTEYGQNMASQEYGNIFDRLATIAGYGQVANTNSQNAVNSSAAMMGNAYQGIAGAGAYRASGQVGQANSWATTFNQLGALAGQWGGASGYDGTSDYLAAAGRAGVSNPSWP